LGLCGQLVMHGTARGRCMVKPWGLQRAGALWLLYGEGAVALYKGQL